MTLNGNSFRISTSESEVCFEPDGFPNTNRVSTSSYSISGALEVMARDSINSFGNVSNKSAISLLDQPSESVISEKYWQLKSLRKEFQERELENQYIKYIRKIRCGFFVIFLITHFILCMLKILILLTSTQGEIKEQLYEIILYGITGIIPLGGFLIKNELTNKYEWLYPLISCVILTVIVTNDVLVVTLNNSRKYDIEYPDLRPTFIEHVYIACYLFLPFDQNYQATVMGVTIAIAYLICLKFITYQLITDLYVQLGCDILYLICLNISGIYRRFLSEITTRRMFLDARQSVQTTMKLTFQKNKEERLLLSILPPQVCKRVQNDIETIFKIMNSKKSNIINSVKPFQDLYIEQHYDVTILYADIVHYTKMTTTLPVKKLVVVLNELFGAFDDASGFHKLLRIKFLGDCYYCVAGIPQVADSTAHLNHAKKAVEFGYDMISIIQYVRNKHDVDIDMRIGVHSGRILSGLVGASKWQYDIWSKDVLIANVMEQTGKPGKVHVTNDTLMKLDSLNEYNYERTYVESRNQFLFDNGIVAYLILPKIDLLMSVEEPSTSSHQLYDKRVSIGKRSSNVPRFSNRSKTNMRLRKQSIIEKTLPTSNRRQFFMDDTYKEYQEMFTLIDSKMDEEIDNLPMGKFDFLSKNSYFNHLYLFFNIYKWEKLYLSQPDPMFKFYIISGIITFSSIFFIQLLSLQGNNQIVWISSTSFLIILLLFIPLTWVRYTRIDQNNFEETSKRKLTERIMQRFKICSNAIVHKTIWRYIIYIFICVSMMLCVLTPLIDCKLHPTDIVPQVKFLGESYHCIKPWHITQTVSLLLLTSFMFLRIHFVLKLLINLMITSIYAWIIWDKRYKYYGESESWNVNFSPQWSHTLTILFLTITGHIIDRQQEFMNRLDYQWKIRLTKERDEAATTDCINIMLLHNILPLHVAKIYMNPRRETNSLYYEEYTSVSVIFASLLGYKLGVDDENEDSELTMLRVLNTIICDFDRLLIEHKGTKVEKIKMAGWTYMAACGLVPEQQGSVRFDNKEIENDVVITIIKLAIKFLKILDTINKESQQKFQLRIGISHGPVSAGVVGSLKPLYDIWGDTVNMASRMDSTGVPNKIQITAETAKVLEKQNIECELRSKEGIFVKGKGMVQTYFIKLNEKFDIVNCNSTLT